MTYIQKLQQALSKNNSCLCIGLDPNLSRIPAPLKKNAQSNGQAVLRFLKQIIDLTADTCAAYKPNLGFFEALGAEGLSVFKEIAEYIPDDKIIIADAKRGDISSTAEHYAKAYFEVFDVDAVTINPLMGFESLSPFLNYKEKGVYTLTLTSNPGAADFLMQPFGGKTTMASYISSTLADMQKGHSSTHLGMVIGATKAAELTSVLQEHPKAALLIPGIGTQGGSVDELKDVLKGHPGLPLINSSRGILYAGEHTQNWQNAVRDQARKMQQHLDPICQNYV